MLAHLLGALGQVELSAGNLLFRLCLSILLPLGIGKYLRRHVVAWVDAQRSRLSLISNAALISIPWMKFSESSERLAQVETAVCYAGGVGACDPCDLPGLQRGRLRAVAAGVGSA